MIKVWADVAWNDYCNFFELHQQKLIKMAAPAPWAAAEPEITG